ncbi:hypothetical protein F5Y08DRAFT_12831 [Xylaria arbuscula]|nr:hypothetical protein F5Y08DRAFT_12831 [Xylaria arbuscula]
MDPLSVAAAVAGLVKAAQEVTKLLRLYTSTFHQTPHIAAHVRDEVDSTRTILVGLQVLVQRRISGQLIKVEQVVAILTSGVLLFAELEGTVRGLVSPSLLPSEESGDQLFSLTQYNLPLRARVRWTRRKDTLEPLLVRLQGFKVSVTVVLSLLQCDSSSRAEELQGDLTRNVDALLDSNRELSQRMMQIEHALTTPTTRPQTIKSSLTTAVSENRSSIARLSNALVHLHTDTITSASSNVPRAFEFEKKTYNYR